MHDPFAPREAQARTLSVIEVALIRGKGTTDDPVRRVLAYFDLDGDFLAERDDVPLFSEPSAVSSAVSGESGETA